jgi:hypothetical protein
MDFLTMVVWLDADVGLGYFFYVLQKPLVASTSAVQSTSS